MYPPLRGTPADYIQRAIIVELKKILELESGDHNVDELIAIWNEAPKPGYIRTCTFARWDGECWVKHTPKISKPKTLVEIFAELEKRDEFERRNNNFERKWK
jgi:hypothetical protein